MVKVSGRFTSILVAVSLLLIAAGIWMLLAVKKPSGGAGMRLTASIYPLQYMLTRVALPSAETASIVPAGVEPHEYEPGSRDIVTLLRSRLVVAIGGGFEPWLDRSQQELAKEQVPVIAFRSLVGEAKKDDPHLWLSPRYAIRLVSAIAETLRQIDPANSALYTKNETQAASDLLALDDAYATGLERCARREIVTGHAAFGYLAADYGLIQIPIAGVSPEEEPSPSRLAEVARIVRQKKATTVFTETLLPSGYTQTIAQETGAKVAVLNPVEGLTPEEQKNGADYLSVMRQNLTVLREALGCK